jgi:NADH-quinone oxidoreductase subunit G
MTKIQIDGIYYEVKEGKNLLETCIALGLDLPYFCYHPAMGSVGACRQCAVKKFTNADDKTGKIVMSCMEQVVDGLIISVNDPDAKNFRASVIEGLMTNHPHDCPICDEGGECHLQDMTVMTGHNYRRFIFKKRTHLNQNLGPLIQHEMNRCIQCYRCVRFYRGYAGGKDLNVFGSANHVYFGRQQEGILESEFSGNLVEVCPTGVFTDKTLKKHFTRKWDLTNAPSVCVHCSLGCNTIIGERYGSVRRIMNRYNGEVNGYFLCDRGRFGYEFINHPGRIQKIQIRSAKNGYSEEAENIKEIGGLSEAVSNGKIMGIGSPRASLEANFALLTMVGKENFFHGISRHEQQLVKKATGLLENSMVHSPSLKEIENCDAVFLLGEDVTQTAPMLALALRQATRNKSLAIAKKMGIPKWNDAAVRELAQNIKSPLYIASSCSTKLDDAATETWHAAPVDIARLGFAVAFAINSGAPDIPHPEHAMQETAAGIASALLAAENPLIVTGISEGSEDILNAMVNIVIALTQKKRKPGITIAFPESNSAGLGMLDGNNLDDALELIHKGSVDTLIILENDLYRRTSKEKTDTVFEKCQKVIILDHLMHATAKKADIIFPVATYAESSGTIVNNEGRAQRYYPVLPLNGPVKESWRWIIDLMKKAGKDTQLSWEKFDDIVSSLAHTYPVFSAIIEQLPNAGFRFHNEKIARQTMRFSGRTAINANLSVSEPKPPDDFDSPMNFSMEGYKGIPPANLIPDYWSPGFNSVQAVNKYLDEPNGSLIDGNPGIRLFEPINNTVAEYAKSIPDPFRPGTNELLFIPVYRIFGSEELSSNGKAIAELIPKPFVLMNAREADKLKVNDNELYNVIIKQKIVNVQVKTDNSVPDGVACLSCLLPGMPYVELPGLGTIQPAVIDRE